MRAWNAKPIRARLPDGRIVSLTASEWELHVLVKVTRTTITRRIKNGKSPEEALGFTSAKRVTKEDKKKAMDAFFKKPNRCR